MNRLLIRILTGMIFALIAAMAVMTVIFNLFYGRLFTYHKWYPIQHTAELIQYIIDKTPQEKINQEIDYLSAVLNRGIDVVSINDDAVPEDIRQGLSEGLLTYGKTRDDKKIFFAPVQQGRKVVLIDPSYQQYKAVLDPFLFIMNIVVLLVLAVIIGCWLAYPINRRLNDIEAASEKIRKGDIAVRIPNPLTDLIGNVERCFNQMADRIQLLVTNRQYLLSTIVRKFQIPIEEIDGYMKGLRIDNAQNIKERSREIDEAVNDIELLVSDLLTQEKTTLPGYRGQANESQRNGSTNNTSDGVHETPQGEHIHPGASVHSRPGTGVIKFFLRISFGILAVLLLHQSLMLARSQIIYKYTEKNPSWYPVHTIATLIQRAIDLTPREEEQTRLNALEAGLERRIELVSSEDASRRFIKTFEQEFPDRMTYGLFNGRNVYSAPVHGSSYVLMIDPAFALFRSHPSIIYHFITLTIQFTLTVLFGILLSMPIIRNLKKLMDGIERIRQGNLDARVDIPLNKPIGTLAGHLNGMAERIQSLLNHQRHLIQAVVHEIRTPVSRIRFHLEMLMDTKDRGETNKRIGDIKEEIEELKQLVMELSAFTSLYDMKEDLATEDVPLYDTLKEITTYYQKTNSHIHIALFNDADKDVNITAHPVYFRRAVQNILSNAIRHARERISIRWTCAEERIIIEIGDDGPGIPEEARDMVFEPFTRLDHSRNRLSGGFGLGLAIARRIISLHGGAISIYDNSPQGARIATWWPCSNHF